MANNITGSDMEPKQKSIPTRFAGLDLASRLEARWVAFLRYLKEDYLYESLRFHLPGARWYRPDLYLPRPRLYLEIKGRVPTPDEHEKCWLISLEQSVNIAIFHDLPGDSVGWFYVAGQGHRVVWRLDHDDNLALDLLGDARSERECLMGQFRFLKLVNAFITARRLRFDHSPDDGSDGGPTDAELDEARRKQGKLTF